MSPEHLRYEQRIKELEEQLLKTTKALNEYRKEYEEFIQIASHDLQAPLRKLSTFIERLTNKFKEVTAEESTGYIERIKSNISGMRSLIDNLSVLASVTEAKKDFRTCNLNELLQNVLEMRQAMSENNLVVKSTPLPVIEGDCLQLQQLFENLIDNSIKFQKEGASIQISITSEQLAEAEKKDYRLPADKKYYKVAITDNGIGFDDEFSEKIFQPLRRLHGKSDYAGDGLGLAICKKIVENHGGIIYAHGNKNSGTRFILILPEIAN